MSKKNTDYMIEEARKEAVFFDKEYFDADDKQRLENYIVPEKLIRQVTHPSSRPLNEREYACFLLGCLEGKKLLDYGCGDGWNTVCFAKAKAKVWATDISENGVELTKKKAAANGVSELVTAEVQNCYETQFLSDMFDIIYGGGILHHLDVQTAGQELSRILHPNGIAVFYEPIRENKIMDTIKAMVLRVLRRKPSEETENETPMTIERINLLKPYFKIINYRFFNVLSSANVLFNSELLKSLFLWADYMLINYLPGYFKLGRGVVIELRQPIKNL